MRRNFLVILNHFAGIGQNNHFGLCVMSETLYLRLPQDLYWSRSILPGIAEYIRKFTDMRLENHEAGSLFKALKNNPQPHVGGFIGMLHKNEPKLISLLQRKQIPAVNIAGADALNTVPTVTHDNQAIGRLAAEHFLELGLEKFGFAGIPTYVLSNERFAGYAKRLARARVANENIYTFHRGKLSNWLKSLPKPVGLFCVSADIELEICRWAEKLNIHIPNELALIGVQDDPYQCELSTIPLTTIRLDYEEVGYRAADLLCSTKYRIPRRTNSEMVPPSGITIRLSSDRLTAEDPLVRSAIRMIREPRRGRIMADEIASRLNISRRTLEVRFRKATGKSLFEEIHRERMNRAQHLLKTTNQTVKSIGEEVGISDTKRFISIFKKQFGETPGTFRSP